MCGRYHLSQAERFAERNRIRPVAWKAAYNIAPTMEAPIWTSARRDELVLGRWGLVPWFSQELNASRPLHNARGETAHELASFKSAFARKPCLVPADGFYEWPVTGPKGHKTAHRIYLPDAEVFAFAGLWEMNTKVKPGAELLTYTIITTAPNDRIAQIHDRQPLILAPEQYDRWLDPELPIEERRAMLMPFPAEQMDAYPVDKTKLVRDSQTPEALEPVGGKVSETGLVKTESPPAAAKPISPPSAQGELF
jgi:putative SOS response-associated peptidase YedK